MKNLQKIPASDKTKVNFEILIETKYDLNLLIVSIHNCLLIEILDPTRKVLNIFVLILKCLKVQSEKNNKSKVLKILRISTDFMFIDTYIKLHISTSILLRPTQIFFNFRRYWP